MATRPHCRRFLDEHHRCAGLWHLHVRVLLMRLVGVVIGGAVALVIAPRSWAAFVIATILGLIMAEAIP